MSRRGVISGERVSTAEGGFNPTWQRHVAAYELCAPLLPEGDVLDLGCGVGHSYRALAPRRSIGVDVSAASLAGQQRETHVADMRRLPFEAGRFGSVLSVHSIEHVPDPERVLAEAARVLAAGGTAVFVTPNRLTFAAPDEIIDPYHYVELDPDQMRSLCRRRFRSVEIRGIAGSARYLEIVAAERERLIALLRRDPLRLRRLVPRRVRQRLYDRLLTNERNEPDLHAAAITPADFTLVDDAVEAALDVVAVCAQPLSEARSPR